MLWLLKKKWVGNRSEAGLVLLPDLGMYSSELWNLLMIPEPESLLGGIYIYICVYTYFIHVLLCI